MVVDNRLCITDAYIGWPGCTHDARVLRNSSLYSKAMHGDLFSEGEYIIGDSAYPLQEWLITPFKNTGHLTARQKKFNAATSKARQKVERAIGHTKVRFRRLREVPMFCAEKVCKIILAGAVLHNLCVLSGDEVQDFLSPEVADQGTLDNHPNRYPGVYCNDRRGLARRQNLVELLPD